MAGRKYSKEFRQEAVEMTNVPGVTLKQLGEELGVTAALWGRWRRQLRTNGVVAFPDKGKANDKETAALKRKLGRVHRTGNPAPPGIRCRQMGPEMPGHHRRLPA